MIFWRKKETRAQRIKRAGKYRYLTFVMWRGEVTGAIGR